MPEACDMVWSAEPTTPAVVDAALRRMIVERHAEQGNCVPARTLNLVCVVEAPSRDDIVRRLEGPSRYHASRTIVCSVEPERSEIGAWARVASEMHPSRPGAFAALLETVVLNVGERHVPHLESIVDPIVVSDLPTVIWSPDGRDDALRALRALSQVVLLDSVDEPAARAAMRRAHDWLEQVRVVDLAWLRTAPWRERVADSFDPPPLRADLAEIRGLSVRHQRDSVAAALLLAGWLAARLEWRVGALRRRAEALEGVARAGGRDVRVVLEPDPAQRVPGLAGMTLETGSGRRLSLDRSPGGLRALQRGPGGAEREWTLLGASRGEPGILGEGIRQALLQDPVYDRALAVATELTGEL